MIRAKKQITEEEAQARLEQLCVRAEHCSHELREKLRKWGILPDVAERILDSLADNKFYDDSRFATAFTRDKLLYSRWGKMKIAAALRMKRIPASIIATAADEIDDDEYLSAARSFLTAKARSIHEGYTYEGRTKLYRAGLARGFESSLITPIVKDPATWPETED